jgi:hypothetical protein
MAELPAHARSRRIAEGAGFVVVWVAIGLIFKLGDSLNRQSLYLVIGIPLTIVFQLFVRRRPLHELWVRNGPRLEARTLFVPAVIGTLAAFDIYANVTSAHPFASPFDAPALRDLFVSFGTYVPAVFVVEEVWPRRPRLAHPPSRREARPAVGGVGLVALELMAPAESRSTRASSRACSRCRS